ncbi:MAG: aminofutalosine synthase MqnE [Bacteroidia bacterium]|nr:aminofutalosine synthase MqnE [Bacteroidia bacterium]MDW8158836.1 aminofutalosine synthase MqnE [Bacteroidia bacterium]
MFKFRNLTAEQIRIINKVENQTPLSEEDALFLYRSRDIAFIGALAHYVRTRLHGLSTYFNRNFHIEPTNICIYDCAFCSFARRPGQEGAWEYTLDEIENICRSYVGKPVTEVHIVGGVHPKRGVEYYGEMIQRIKKILPHIHVKAFTAVELKVMFARSKMSIEEGLLALKNYGLDSLPGGGAEIFHPEVREKICDTKASTENWLTIHRTAHQLGIPSNCTMLYGHIEKYEHRVHHMMLLRRLQEETHGFNTFIPLKFRNENNSLSHIPESTIVEDLKNYAVARLYLHNISHIKAYWPMIGKTTTQLSLSFGVNDVDGTIDDTTKIYSMAGAEDKNPVMTTEQLVQLIESAGFIPIERNSIYTQFQAAVV